MKMKEFGPGGGGGARVPGAPPWIRQCLCLVSQVSKWKSIPHSLHGFSKTTF